MGIGIAWGPVGPPRGMGMARGATGRATGIGQTTVARGAPRRVASHSRMSSESGTIRCDSVLSGNAKRGMGRGTPRHSGIRWAAPTAGRAADTTVTTTTKRSR